MAHSRKALLTLLKAVDLSLITASFIVAVGIAIGAPDWNGWVELLGLRVRLDNALFVAAYLTLWHFVLRGCGLYTSYRLSPASRELRDLGAAVIIAIAPLIILSPLFHFAYATASFFTSFATLTLVGLGVERRLLRALGARVRRYGRNLRNVVIIGDDDWAFHLTSKLARRDDLGYHVVEVIQPAPVVGGAVVDRSALLQRLETLIEQRPIDEVFVALPLDSDQVFVRSLLASCEEQGVTVRLIAQVASLNWARATMDAIDGQPVLTMYTGTPDTLALVVKRAVDVAGASLGLLVLAPLLVLAAIAIKLDSHGPVFFAQERIGLNRRRFRALKFRTMVDGAEDMQAALEPLNEAEGPVFKISSDPRINRVGKVLRRTSLDELPQLINVLRGEMSLVGPRPLPLRDVRRIDVRWHKRRFSVKPGITCLWQVNSRQPKFDEWIHWDMEYIDNWSLALDFKILARTIPAVLSGQGAH